MNMKPNQGVKGKKSLGKFKEIFPVGHSSIENQLQISELKFKRLFETAQDGILLLDANTGAITEVNPFLLKLLGYTHDEITGKKLWEISLFKNIKANKDAFKELQKKKFIRYENLPLQTKSGDIRYVEFVSNIYQVGEKKIIQCNIRDITDRKIFADSLQDNETRFRELFNRMSSCVAVYEAVENGKDFIIKDFNAAAERVEKTPKQKVLGRKVTEVFPGIREMNLLNTFRQVWKTGKAQSHPVSIYKDNHIFGWRENFIYKLPSGEIVAIYEDMTERKQIEEKMNWLASFPEINPLFVLEVDQKTQVRYANHSVKINFPEIETADAHHPLLKRLPEIIRQLLQEDRKSITIEIEAGGKWYSEIICTISNSPNYRIYANDITDLKKIELDRKKSEEKYQRIIETAQEAIWVIDQEMKTTFVNKQMTRLLGCSAEEIIGHSIIDFYFPEDLTDLNRRMKLRMKGIAETYDRRLKRKDGSVLWTSVSVSPLLDAQGNMEGTFAMFTDISERKRNENALQLLSDTQRQLVQLEDLNDVFQLVGSRIQELIGDGYVIISELDEPLQLIRTAGLFGFGSNYESFVQRFHIDPTRMTYPLKEMSPDELRLFRSGSLERFPHGLYNLMVHKVPKSICRVAEKKLGIWEIYIMGFLRHDAHFGGLTILAKSDITFNKPFIEIIMQQASTAIYRIKSDLELRESEKRFRSLYENATVGMYRTAPDGRILMANPALVRMIGYPSFEELAQRNLEKDGYETGYSRQDFRKHIEQEGELHGIESAWQRKNGSVIFVRESAKAIREQNGKVIYYEGTVEDISERRNAEITLRESEAHYRGLFVNSPISLWEEDFSAVKKRLDELKKRGILDMRSYLESHPKEIAHCVSLIKVLDVNKATLKLFHAKNKADLLKPLSNVLSPQTLHEFREELNFIAEGRTNFNWETKNQTATGKTIDVLISWSVAPGHENDLSKVIISLIDITERKRAQQTLLLLSETQAQLAQTNDQDALFHLVGSKIHELIQEGYVAIAQWDKEPNNLQVKGLFGFGNKFHKVIQILKIDPTKVTYNLEDISPEQLELWSSNKLSKYEGDLYKLLTHKIPESLCHAVEKYLRISAIYVMGFVQQDQGHGTLSILTEHDISQYKYAIEMIMRQASITLNRIKAKTALEESERRFRSLFENSPISLWEEDHSEVKNYLDKLKQKGIIDFRDYFIKHPQEVKKCLNLVKIIDINNATLKTYGANDKSNFLNDLSSIFTESSLTSHVDQLVQIADGKRTIDQETEAKKINGEKMTHLVRWQVASGFEDSLSRVIVTIIDITDRKQAEERQKILAEEEHKQRVFSEALTKNALSLNSTLKTEELLDAIIDNIQNVIPFEAVSIILIEGGHGKIVRSKGFAEKGLAAYVEQKIFDFSTYKTYQKIMDSGSYVLIPDTRTDPIWIQDDEIAWKILSCVETPIKEDNKVIGFLTLNSSIPNFYNEEHAKQLMVFTDQVSNAMKNARLFENTQRRMKRMNAMTLIDQAINSSLDINVSLEIVLIQTLEQLGADASDILMVNFVSNTLTFANAKGFRTNEITKSNLGLGAGLSGQAILERRVISIPDLRSAPESYFRNLLINKEGFISYYCVPLITKGLLKGVMEVYFRKAFEADQEWLEFIEMLAQQTAIAINNAELRNSLQISNSDLKNAYDATLQGWVEALDLRDKENEGHSLRVTDTTLRLVILMNVEDKDMTNIKRGALLHDIGKISISDLILNKPGPLSEEEWKIMRKHPDYAFQLLSKTKYLRDALDIPYCHHEKWDGSGYPRGLKGEAIPLAARIFAIVDVWDALTSDRPYRPAWSHEKALEYIQEQSGKHFDPQVVNVFVNNLKSLNLNQE